MIKRFSFSIEIFRQHPHKLSTKDVQESGEVLLRKSVQQKKKIEIKDVGIVFVKKQRIEESLTLRMKRNIDPTKGEKFDFCRFFFFGIRMRESNVKSLFR